MCQNPCKINETTGRLTSWLSHCLEIKFKKAAEPGVLILATGPSFLSPLCLVLFFIGLLLGRKVSFFLLILLQHKPGGGVFYQWGDSLPPDSSSSSKFESPFLCSDRRDCFRLQLGYSGCIHRKRLCLLLPCIETGGNFLTLWTSGKTSKIQWLTRGQCRLG